MEDIRVLLVIVLSVVGFGVVTLAPLLLPDHTAEDPDDRR